MIHREEKTAPKDLKCSNPDCKTTIRRGERYYRHGFGRYCPTCSNSMKELRYKL